MDKEQGKKEFIKIIQEANRKATIIEKKAKENGTWQKGLDSNRALFKENDDETKKKIELLKTMINED